MYCSPCLLASTPLPRQALQDPNHKTNGDQLDCFSTPVASSMDVSVGAVEAGARRRRCGCGCGCCVRTQALVLVLAPSLRLIPRLSSIRRRLQARQLWGCGDAAAVGAAGAAAERGLGWGGHSIRATNRAWLIFVLVAESISATTLRRPHTRIVGRGCWAERAPALPGRVPTSMSVGRGALDRRLPSEIVPPAPAACRFSAASHCPRHCYVGASLSAAL